MDFITLIISNWIGLLIGLVTSALLCLVIGFTLFRNNKIAGTIISLLLVVVFAFAGVLIQDYFFSGTNKGYEQNTDITNDEVVRLDGDKYIHILTTGGFTRDYVTEHRPDAPMCDDKYGKINMVEYKDVVVFYYDINLDNRSYVVNAIFTKAKNGLVFDGCFNIKLNYHRTGNIFSGYKYWFDPTSTDIKTAQTKGNLVELTEMWRGDNFSNLNHQVSKDDGYDWPFSGIVYPRYFCQTRPSKINGLCGHNFWSSIVNDNPSKNIMYKSAMQLCYGIFETYFENLGDISVLLDEGQTSSSMNVIYNDIYKAVAKSRLKTSVLDVTEHFYYAKADDNDSSKVTLYNNRCLLSVNYINNSAKNAFKTDTEDKEEKKYADSITNTTDIELVSNPQVTIKLVNRNNVSLNGFDISKSPVSVVLTGASGRYNFIFDTTSELQNGIIQGIPVGNYSVKIDSNVLDIINQTTLDVTTSNNIFLLDFGYEYNTILTSVRLNKLSNLDVSSVDLSTNPVTITLNNGTSSYNYVFDSLEKLDQTITKRLPMGEYNYSIVSNELAFSSTSGKITVDANNYSFIFNYDYKTNVEYKLNCSPLLISNIDGSYPDSLDLSLQFSSLILSSPVQSVVMYDTFKNARREYNLAIMENFAHINLEFDLDYSGEHIYQALFTLENGEQIVTNILGVSVDMKASTSTYLSGLNFSISL